jgi:hypothetical protein
VFIEQNVAAVVRGQGTNLSPRVTCRTAFQMDSEANRSFVRVGREMQWVQLRLHWLTGLKTSACGSDS